MSDIITTYGSDWYWAVTAVMAAATLAFMGLSFSVPRRNRIFHVSSHGGWLLSWTLGLQARDGGSSVSIC